MFSKYIFALLCCIQLGTSTISPPSAATSTKNNLENALLKIQTFGDLINNSNNNNNNKNQQLCTCGVFLNGQFKRRSNEPPKGNPALLHEQDVVFPCNAQGNKQCTNRCLDSIVKHLPNSPSIICGTIDRDCHKERAYLFIQNCNSTWINTNLSAGREYCCKDGASYKCPLA